MLYDFNSKTIVQNKHLIRIQKSIFNQINKNFLLLIVQILIFIPMVICIVFGFNSTNSNLPVQEISENTATYRSISLFLILWYIAIYCFIVSTKSSKTIQILNILSFIPIFNIINILYIIFKNNWCFFLLWFKSNFEPDWKLDMVYSRASWKYKMMIALLVIMTPIIVLVLYQKSDYLNTYPNNGDGDIIVYNNLWFCSLQYFTIQTNLLCYLFVLLFVIKPNMKIFKHHTFLISCIVYIFVVGVTYDFALFPIKIVNGEIYDWNWYKYLTNIYEHLINPIAFVTCGLILICKDNPQILRLKYKQYIIYTMIVPTIYLIYALIMPFVTNVSVYGFVTNCNPDVYNEMVIDSTNFMSHGQWYNIFFIIGYWFLFIGLLSGMFYLDLKKANKWKGFNYVYQKRYY